MRSIEYHLLLSYLPLVTLLPFLLIPGFQILHYA